VRTIADTVPPPERTLAREVLAWTAEYLRQPDGVNAGAPWSFTREQARALARWYEIDDAGRFRYRRGVLRRCKGWGKSPFGAALSAVELCAPCRFGGFDADGMPVAVCHPSPWIQVAAVNSDQTRNVLRALTGMFTDAAIDEYRIDLGKQITYSATGQIEAVTSSPRALEGGRATLVILDESQEWIESNKGHAMALAIRRNAAKSPDGSSRSLELANAHLPGENSVAELTYEAWSKANGQIDGLMYDSVEGPPVADLTDVGAVRSAIEVARGDSTWLDVDRLAAEIADPTTPAHIAHRYFLNRVVAIGAERWMDPELWASRARPEIEIPRGSRVVLGFDGGWKDDSTALVVVLLGEVPHIDLVRLWAPPPHDPDWTVSVLDVEDEIRECCRRWRVREIAADASRWQRSLSILLDEGHPCVEFPQSAPRMIRATASFMEAVSNGTMTHSGNPDLSQHVLNAVIHETRNGDHLRKDKRGSQRKIDAAIAAVMGHDRALHYRKRGVGLVASGWDLLHGVYDDDGEDIAAWAAEIAADERNRTVTT
jgi:terminase large subunit-like protein